MVFYWTVTGTPSQGIIIVWNIDTCLFTARTMTIHVECISCSVIPSCFIDVREVYLDDITTFNESVQ